METTTTTTTAPHPPRRVESDLARRARLITGRPAPISAPPPGPPWPLAPQRADLATNANATRRHDRC